MGHHRSLVVRNTGSDPFESRAGELVPSGACKISEDHHDRSPGLPE